MNNSLDISSQIEEEHGKSDALFLEHLPTRLTAIKRLYAAQVRKSFEEGLIDSATVIKLCELIKSPKLTEGSLEERLFFSILGISSVPRNNLSPAERAFLQELVEWMLIGVLGESVADALKNIVISRVERLTEEGIDAIRKEYSLHADKIMQGIKNKGYQLDFRSIPPEIIPFLSNKVRDFIFKISRAERLSGTETYNKNMLHHSQNEALIKSLPL